MLDGDCARRILQSLPSHSGQKDNAETRMRVPDWPCDIVASSFPRRDRPAPAICATTWRRTPRRVSLPAGSQVLNRHRSSFTTSRQPDSGVTVTFAVWSGRTVRRIEGQERQGSRNRRWVAWEPPSGHYARRVGGKSDTGTSGEKVDPV